MRITIDARLLGRGGQSGIHVYTTELLRALIAQTPHDRIQLFYNGLRLAPLPHDIACAPNVRVINWRIPNALLGASFTLTGLPRLDRHISSDVFFSPHFDLVAPGTTPHVMTFHDLSFVHYPSFFSFRQRVWHARQLYAAAARRATHLIADSLFIKSDLVALLHLPPEKISVVPLAAHTRFRPLPPHRPRKFPFPFLLTLSTLEPRKNILGLLRAFELLRARETFRNLHLVIAGSPGWLYNDLLRAISASPHRSFVHLLGAVSLDEQVVLYNECEVFVYPSFFEGFGLPPLEAQACGASVVAADRAALPEVLGDGALFVDPWNTDALVDAIARCVTDISFARALRERGRANAARFSWNATAQATLHILRYARNSTNSQ